MESQQGRVRYHVVESIYWIFYILLGLALSILGVSTNFARLYLWGEVIWPGTIADYWGARIYPGYYVWRDSAIALFAITSLFYLLIMYMDTKDLAKSRKGIGNWHLYAGLLLPSMFTFGDPGGVFYNGFVGYSLTGMISPIYIYSFTGWTGAIISPFMMYTPLSIPSLIVFALGFLQVISLRLYEKNRIQLWLFLIPSLTSLIFTVLLTGNIIPSSYFAPQYFPNLVTFTFSVPILTIAVLIRAIGVRDAR